MGGRSEARLRFCLVCVSGARGYHVLMSNNEQPTYGNLDMPDVPSPLPPAFARAWPTEMSRSDPMDPRLAMSPQYQRYREMTIDELLLENRTIFLVGEINYPSATGVIMRLLYLQQQKKGVDINLYINSHGGSVDDTLAIYDTIQYLDCEVSTVCIGRAQSGGAIVLAAGAKGKRYILPHARVMIHQPFGGVTGQTTDVQIQAEEILRAKSQLNELLAKHTGKDSDQVEQDSERDRYFSAEEARDYGLVDEVLQSGDAKSKDENKSK